MRTGEEVARVHIAVAQKLERAAVQLVGAGFCDYVDDGAAAAAILGAVAVSLHAELFERIRIGKRIVYVGVMILVAPAIQVVVDIVGARTVGSDGLRARIGCGLLRVTPAARVAGLQIRGAGGQQHEGGCVASVERKIENVPQHHDPAQCAAARLHEVRIGLHGNRLRSGADLETDRHGGRLIRFDLNPFLLGSAETRGFDANRICSDGQQRKEVRAIDGALRIPREARGNIRYGDLGSDNSRAAGIENCSGDRASRVSSVRRADEEADGT